MSISCDCCVMSRSFYDGPITCAESPRHVMSKTECDLEISIMRRPTSIRAVIPWGKFLT